MEDDFIIVTTNELPGYEIVAVHGEVCGLIVRARNAFSNVGASFRTVFGGEVKGYTALLVESRQHAVDRLREDGHGGSAGTPSSHALRLQRDREHHERGRGLRHVRDRPKL